MKDKCNQIFKQRVVSTKKVGIKSMPSLTLNGYDLINSDFFVNDKVIISYDYEKIVIRKAHSRETTFLFNEIKEENPTLQILIDRLGLVLI